MKFNRNKYRNKLVFLSLTAALGIGLVFFTFNSDGLMMRLWKADLSFLLSPILILLISLIVSSALPLFLRDSHSQQYSIILQYSAMAVFTFMVFGWLTLLSRFPALSGQLDILNTLTTSAVFVALFWVGSGCYRISTLLAENKPSSRTFQPLMAMLGFALVSVSFWKTLDDISAFWPILNGTGFMIGMALIVVALSRLFAYISSPMTFMFGEIIKWSVKFPAKLFLMVVLVLAYFVYARPMLYAISDKGYLIEWVIICFAGYQILNTVKKHLNGHCAQSAKETHWEKHQQRVDEIADDDFNKMIILQQEFIESAIRRNLLQFLKQLLVRNGIQEIQIHHLLQPLIEYSDAKRHWYQHWFFKKQLLQANRYHRSQALEDTFGKIRAALYPAHKYIKGVTNERYPIG